MFTTAGEKNKDTKLYSFYLHKRFELKKNIKENYTKIFIPLIKGAKFNVTSIVIHLRRIQFKKLKFQYLVNLFIPYYCHFYRQSYLFVVIIQ